MSEFVPDNMATEWKDGVTETAPLIPRRYTLTHSDETGELFLTIAPDFSFYQLTAMRDEVLGEWMKADDTFRYYVYLHIDGPFGQGTEAIRDTIFRRELPLALKAIRYGDKLFFEAQPEMDHYPIIVYFLSFYPEYNKIEDWGTFADYTV